MSALDTAARALSRPIPASPLQDCLEVLQLAADCLADDTATAVDHAISGYEALYAAVHYHGALYRHGEPNGITVELVGEKVWLAFYVDFESDWNWSLTAAEAVQVAAAIIACDSGDDLIEAARMALARSAA